MNRLSVNEKEIVWRIIDGQAIILRLNQTLRSESIYTFNPTGTFIWYSITKKKSLEEIVSKLCLEFDVDSILAKKETKNFIKTLIKNKLLNEI